MQTKQDLIQWLEENQAPFVEMADALWAEPEVAWQEFKSSKRQADFMEGQGFRVTWDIDGINTAFVAEWGRGRPIIGFVGEYDALAGLSQKNQPSQEPIVKGAPGHGCGHNLLGTGCLAAAVAIKEWLDACGHTGTVRYYGCPAEEQISGKTFMARAGAFDDLDAALNYHPGKLNMPGKGSAVGVNDIVFKFHGTAAHAGGSPHKGRSALDAVELMNVGVNYLREHVSEKVRIHYTITHGGDVPNIVPPEAQVWYFVRAHKRDELDQVVNRVRKIAQGATLMTETTVEEIFRGGCSSVLNNHYLADLHYEAMALIGPISFTEDELAYARQINDAFPDNKPEDVFHDLQIPDEWQTRIDALKGQPLIGENFPALDQAQIETGSTDVGDVSQITPLSMLNTTCFATAAPGHNWSVVATSGMSIGHKGMIHAAKIMAVVAYDLYSDPAHLQKAREEFVKATQDNPYVSPLPEQTRPPQHPNPERNVP
ncbi:MAG: amidohydrolase [Anaerolineae bacterium]|nr:amidohydrolase [Anaerolineae bacterium]